MALFSVLASTTRKFFCASGGCVTCCCCQPSVFPRPSSEWWGLTPTPASSMPVTVFYRLLARELGGGTDGSVCITSSPITARNCRSLYAEAGAAMVCRSQAAAAVRLALGVAGNDDGARAALSYFGALARNLS